MAYKLRGSESKKELRRLNAELQKANQLLASDNIRLVHAVRRVISTATWDGQGFLPHSAELMDLVRLVGAKMPWGREEEE